MLSHWTYHFVDLKWLARKAKRYYSREQRISDTMTVYSGQAGGEATSANAVQQGKVGLR